MLYPRIKYNKVRVGRQMLTELEVRNLQLMVVKGELPAGIKIKHKGGVATIQKDGSFDMIIQEFSQTIDIELELFKLQTSQC